jgi:hypothetical protein
VDRELNDGTIGYIVYTDESLREKEESEVRGKEGFSLGTCSARASQASRMRVACASQLYNYMLRFHLTMPPPLKRVVPDSLRTQALIKPRKKP